MSDAMVRVFENEKFGRVRTVEINGEPWFVGKDVAAVLGYTNTRDALNRHVDDEDKNCVVIHDGIPGNPNQTVINESGLYSLIIASKLPRAKEFKHWVTSEVLPSIGKNGMYMNDATLERAKSDPVAFMGEVAKMAAEREQRLINERDDARRERDDAQRKLRQVRSQMTIQNNRKAVFDFINKCVRSYAGTTHTPLAYAWGEYYDRLLGRIGVDLRTRKKPYIKQLTQHEVIDALAVAKEMPTKEIAALVGEEMIDTLKLIVGAIREIDVA